MSTIGCLSYRMFTSVHYKHNMCCWVTESIEFTLNILFYSLCAQGPVGLEKNQDCCLWLPAAVICVSNPQILREHCWWAGAALGGRQRHQERCCIVSVYIHKLNQCARCAHKHKSHIQSVHQRAQKSKPRYKCAHWGVCYTECTQVCTKTIFILFFVHYFTHIFE